MVWETMHHTLGMINNLLIFMQLCLFGTKFNCGVLQKRDRPPNSVLGARQLTSFILAFI